MTITKASFLVHFKADIVKSIFPVLLTEGGESSGFTKFAILNPEANLTYVS